MGRNIIKYVTKRNNPAFCNFSPKIWHDNKAEHEIKLILLTFRNAWAIASIRPCSFHLQINNYNKIIMRVHRNQ